MSRASFFLPPSCSASRLGTGRVDEARRALLNFDFLLQALEENKGHVPSSRLVLDAEPFLGKLGTDATLAVRALEKAGNALAHDPRELAGQMLARLDEQHPLHEQAKGYRGASWLRPVGGINTLTRADDPLRKILQGHTRTVTSVALQGNTVVSGSWDDTVRVWDLQTGKQLQLLQGHTGWVMSVALQGNTVVSGSDDNTVRVWDLQTGKQLQLLQGHTDQVWSVALQGNTVLSRDISGEERVWQLQGVGARQEETAADGGFHKKGSRVRRDGCDVGFTFDNTVTRASGGDNGFAAIGKHFAAFLVVQPAKLA